MPNCFSLTRKSDVQAGPVKLTLIDEELCQHLGEPVHETHWCRGWYNSVGLLLAMGVDWKEIRERLKDYGDTELPPVVDYLEENFIIDSWVEIGRR